MILDSYTVFDVETANRKRESICSIGYIRVENGAILESKEILINPETDFDNFNMKIHGITPQKVAYERTFPEVWEEIKPYFSNTVLVAHNAKSMDLCALSRTLDRYNLEIPSNDYICTYELAKKLYTQEEVGAYKLNVLCHKFNVPLEHHHNALDDAKACYGLLNHFFSVTTDITPSPYLPNLHYEESTGCPSRAFNYSDKTLAMQELQKIVSNIINDNIITIEEANLLLDWMNSHSDLEGFYPYDKIFNLIEDILSDGIIEAKEEHELLELLDAYINPQTTKLKVNVNNKIICLSGDFDYGSKSEVEQFFVSKGAKISKTVTKKTDILVLGEAGNVAWKYDNYGTKFEKAQQLNEKGANILVFKENDIIGYLGDKVDIDEQITAICDKLTNELELTPNRVAYYKSTSKKGENAGNVVSLFVQIVEMEYPDVKTISSTTSVLRIPADNVSEINLSSRALHNCLIEEGVEKYAAVVVNEGKNNEFIGSRIMFNEINDIYFDFIEKVVVFALKNYSSSNSKFGCCSRFKECSNQGKCIHPNKLYATVCEYKKHLESGNAFYKV